MQSIRTLIGKLKKLGKEAFSLFLKTLFVWLLIGGIACVLKSYYSHLRGDEELSRIFESVGIAVLVGGVLDGVLKSFEFLGIFEDHLVSIVYAADLLARRSDIEEIWRRVSQSLYSSKFKDTNEQIENVILNKYFPSKDMKYYYANASHHIDINRHRELSDYIESSETTKFDVIVIDPSSQIDLPYRVTIEKATSDETSSDFELVHVKVNGELVDETPKITRDAKTLTAEVSIHLSRGGLKHSVELRHRKTYALEFNHTRDFVSSRLISGLEVRVRHGSELVVHFDALGTPDDFDDEAAAFKNEIWKKYKSVIFVNQGYKLLIATDLTAKP